MHGPCHQGAPRCRHLLRLCGAMASHETPERGRYWFLLFTGRDQASYQAFLEKDGVTSTLGRHGSAGWLSGRYCKKKRLGSIVSLVLHCPQGRIPFCIPSSLIWQPKACFGGRQDVGGLIDQLFSFGRLIGDSTRPHFTRPHRSCL